MQRQPHDTSQRSSRTTISGSSKEPQHQEKRWEMKRTQVWLRPKKWDFSRSLACLWHSCLASLVSEPLEPYGKNCRHKPLRVAGCALQVLSSREATIRMFCVIDRDILPGCQSALVLSADPGCMLFFFFFCGFRLHFVQRKIGPQVGSFQKVRPIQALVHQNPTKAPPFLYHSKGFLLAHPGRNGLLEHDSDRWTVLQKEHHKYNL